MAQDLSLPDPNRFNLSSFADMLPARDPIVGEDPGSFQSFHDGMMRSLAPLTPYECVIAENLIAIEWELLQHRRMRDAGLRRHIQTAIRDALRSYYEDLYNSEMDVEYDKFIEEGGERDDWDEPYEFDPAPADKHAEHLWKMCLSGDPGEQETAYGEIAKLGLDPLALLGEAHRSYGASVKYHEEKLPDLERRRREVRRDYDLLQNARPVEGTVIEG
ncbi:hypothetical protein [Marivita geojedonensis]|uniref:Uncharacterized protein n=1 Tax=Marivita geojedonensis TaxID=1123756 RepID=A0A1X4NRJ2_9RHOB|nr:hypothetical protein [Marivita geojedonensis]OSQ53501.1 hypothetical protein MGEO_02950 [Marivita geojedonensis]PRY81495.1 hypothetical protein CLV76_10134 [Marivita geojedonensis]